MKPATRSTDGLIVVDAKLDDYGVLIAAQREHDLRIKLFATGESALRAARASSVALWLINVRLPDMTGIHLLGLVRRRLRRCSVFLVGDTYSADDEVAARQAGATAYVCKPASAAWLESYLPRCRSPAIRAGPLLSPQHEDKVIT
jgi:DNA-binding response OmpR family regulator